MRVLVDAQMPLRLVRLRRAQGHGAKYAVDMPDGDRTTDADIRAAADADGRVVVTKGEDFVDSHLVRGEPAKLCLIAMGNVRNDKLCGAASAALPLIEHAFRSSRFVELARDGSVVVRG